MPKKNNQFRRIMFYYYLRITIKFVLKNKTNTGTDPIINTGTDLYH